MGPRMSDHAADDVPACRKKKRRMHRLPRGRRTLVMVRRGKKAWQVPPATTEIAPMRRRSQSISSLIPSSVDRALQ